MTATQRGVVYGAVSGLPRRGIVPDDDAALQRVFLHPGEALLLLPIDHPNDRASIHAACLAAAGAKMPASASPGRCLAIDATGTVTQVIEADPLIDVLPGQVLMQHDLVNAGWTYAAGAFAPPPLAIDKVAFPLALPDAPIAIDPAAKTALETAFPLLASAAAALP